MIEDYEGLSGSHNRESRDSLSDSQRSYIEEVLPLGNENLLIERIDELSGNQPPKAIDADKDVAALLEPMREDISPLYLEAPQDFEQIEQVSDMMTRIEGLSFDEWKELSATERLDVLQEVEFKVAEIAHRPGCCVTMKSLGEGYFGYYNPRSHDIVLNSDYLGNDSFQSYKECLDTIVHEGRHAYQYYNLMDREVHPREGDLTNWKLNEFEYGYQDASTCGFAAYCLQPQEADARAFAEDVWKKYEEKIA